MKLLERYDKEGKSIKIYIIYMYISFILQIVAKIAIH